ncbi:MAG: hypothetical protein ABIF11_08340 [Nitrospirota bacterium]
MDDQFYDIPFYNMYIIAFFISLICGMVGFVKLLRQHRYSDAWFVAALYVLPPTVFFYSVPWLSTELGKLTFLFDVPQDHIRCSVILLLSPVAALWAGWLFFGGFIVIEGDVNTRDYFRQHLAKGSLRNKAVGVLLMISGVTIYTVTIVLTEPSVIRIVPFWVSILLYFRGVLSLIFPEDRMHLFRLFRRQRK